MKKRRTLIIGAAGRDFHNFNCYCRGNESIEVVGFTAAQIPNIVDRKYPASLAGDAYPDGIPIYDEQELEYLIKDLAVDDCIFSYSDISYDDLMHKCSRVNAAGANFTLLGIQDTSIKSVKPVISVCATRTGTGKSQTSRKVVELLMAKGLNVVVVRHPMPYGDLAAQKVQRFATIDDLKKHECTIEEMEEYEPHVSRGNVIYAGVDYEAILRAAEKDPAGCDIIVWDGGNNDFPFYESDLRITVTDPHRAGHGMLYYAGEISLRMSDVVVINKMDSANAEDVDIVRKTIQITAPNAVVIEARSPIQVENPEVISGKRVLVIEDGPTMTHGGMPFGAGFLAAKNFDAKEIVDPRPYLSGTLKDTFKKYPEIGKLLPAMGYGEQQLSDLQDTISKCDCDSVVIGTPIDLRRIINIHQPTTRVRYNLEEIGSPNLDIVVDEFLVSLRAPVTS